jgi:hypothetical protein
MFFYSLCSLGLQANHPIPGLEPLPGRSQVDVHIQLDGAVEEFKRLLEPPHLPCFVSPACDPQGQPNLTIFRLAGGAFFYLRYGDGIAFVLNREGTAVITHRPAAATPEDVAIYLLGPVLGFVLRLRGISCLHASAVAIGRQALAFLGPPGAGKSTLAAAFARKGYPVLTDDIVVLLERGEVFLVPPASPRLCLWPEAVAALFGSPDALPRLTPENSVVPEWDKRGLNLTGDEYHYQSQPLPLAAIYVLDQRRDGRPVIEALSGREGMVALMANTYRNELLEKPMMACEFDILSKVASHVSVRKLIPSVDPASLPGLCDLIVKDFQSPNQARQNNVTLNQHE